MIDVWPNDKALSVIVFRESDEILAYYNICPHAGWPLDNFDGSFLQDEKKNLICAAHGAVFDYKTGKCLGGPGKNKPLVKYNYSLINNDILIGIIPQTKTQEK